MPPRISTRTCPVCGSDATSPSKPNGLGRELRPEDLRITDGRYGLTLSLRRCADCRFVFAERDEVKRLTDLYARLSDTAYEDGRDTRRLQMQWLLRQVLAVRPRARTLLDVGAGTGLLVEEAQAAGLTAVGVEPSRALVEAGQLAGGGTLLQGVLPHAALEGRVFDVVSLVDVIEHVADPVQLLRDAGRALAADGVMLVVTPDRSSAAARLFGKRWWHFRPAHVGYFCRSSLIRALEAAGLEPESWHRAQWFFRLRYLAERLERYLPLRGLNRVVLRSPRMRPWYERVVRLDLRDSFLVFARHRNAGT